MQEVIKFTAAFAVGMFVMWRVSVHGWKKYYEGCRNASDNTTEATGSSSRRGAPR